MILHCTLPIRLKFTHQCCTLKHKPTNSCLDERPAKHTLTVQEVPLNSGVKKHKIPVSWFWITLIIQYNTFNFQIIFKLPNETIHGICAVTEDKDLRNLLLVNHALGSIASPIYTTQLGIQNGVKSHTIVLEGESFWALGTWKCSRLFARLEHGIQLYCMIDHKNLELAAAQVHCLHTFISADFTGAPFSSIVINGICHMNPTDIVDFIHLINKVGCYSATIMSPYGSYKHSPADIASSFPPVMLYITFCRSRVVTVPAMFDRFKAGFTVCTQSATLCITLSIPITTSQHKVVRILFLLGPFYLHAIIQLPTKNNSDAPLGETRWATLPPTADSEWSITYTKDPGASIHSWTWTILQWIHHPDSAHSACLWWARFKIGCHHSLSWVPLWTGTQLQVQCLHNGCPGSWRSQC